MNTFVEFFAKIKTSQWIKIKISREKMQKINKPFSMDGAGNIRELGGYANKDGKVTKKHEYLRADALFKLSDTDEKYLLDYGLGAIIDLRSDEETDRAPDKIVDNYSQLDYLHVPIQDHVRTARYDDDFPPSMWELYRWLLDDSQESFKKIFRFILDNYDKCILFHCSGGKDRTGTLAMLLLLLASVDEETIINDYAVTEEYMKDIFPVQLAVLEGLGLKVPEHIMRSEPSNMIKTLEYFNDKYSSIVKYLKIIGLSDGEIIKLKSKLI